MNWKTDDTIAAVATPLGVGGIGIVRLSGAAAPEIVGRFFRPSGGRTLSQAPSHTLLHGWWEHEGRTVDEVLAVHMKAPRSYTREEVVEVHCHGGPVVLHAVMELICAAGARPAEAGEFTFRAFVNGRLDLTQAEAVGDIVGARSRLGAESSASQLRGRLHDAIETARRDVGHVAALVAASIDFPEEDVVFTRREDCTARLGGVAKELRGLLAGADRGRILREGLPVAIVGKPNVGKSSLLNALLRENRAIVTDIPGTTRDTLEETVELDGLALRLIDTAGIRHPGDRIEQAGIDRSHRAIEQARLVVLVLDGAAPLTPEDESLLERAPPGASLLAVNKRDLMEGPEPTWLDRMGGHPWVALSALTGQGLEHLEQAILRWALGGPGGAMESPLITNLRQQDAAGRALGAIERALGGLDAGRGEELLAVDLAEALDALGDIVGETTAEDLLERIFAQFCIGK